MAVINNDVAADAPDVLPEEEEVQICLFNIGEFDVVKSLFILLSVNLIRRRR